MTAATDLALFARVGLGADSSYLRAGIRLLFRPLLTLTFFVTNLQALLLGLFERDNACPLSISCLVRITKNTN